MAPPKEEKTRPKRGFPNPGKLPGGSQKGKHPISPKPGFPPKKWARKKGRFFPPRPKYKGSQPKTITKAVLFGNISGILKLDRFIPGAKGFWGKKTC